MCASTTVDCDIASTVAISMSSSLPTLFTYPPHLPSFPIRPRYPLCKRFINWPQVCEHCCDRNGTFLTFPPFPSLLTKPILLTYPPHLHASPTLLTYTPHLRFYPIRMFAVPTFPHSPPIHLSPTSHLPPTPRPAGPGPGLQLGCTDGLARPAPRRPRPGPRPAPVRLWGVLDARVRHAVRIPGEGGGGG